MADDTQGNNWFDDDPEWADLKRRTDGQPASKKPKHSKIRYEKPPEEPEAGSEPIVDSATNSEDPKKVNVSVNLSLPRLKLPKKPKMPDLSRRQIAIGGSVAGLLVVGVIVLGAVSLTSKDDKKEVAGVSTGQRVEPSFDVVLPDGKKDETTSKKVAFDPDLKVASFTDSIGNVTITVSEQPLPEQFKSNPDEEVKKMAAGFSATDVIAESNPKAYIGTSAKGPQTVIFHKNGLLIFIKSTSKLDKEQWSEYITKLI